MTRAGIRITPLAFDDEVVRRLQVPAGEVELVRGVGSGLSLRAGDPPGRMWSVGDRGPNVKAPFAVARYGLTGLAGLSEVAGAKIMPCPDIGPAIFELQLEGDRVMCLRCLPLRDGNGRAISGLPPASGLDEVAFDLDGRVTAPDPSGADSEGIIALADGTFWIGDEYGPSLLHAAADGTVLARWVPAGCEGMFAGAAIPVTGALPAIAAKRQFNRGFEALALSEDGAWLYLAFQSPLAHPDAEAHRRARHVRLWKLDAATGEVVAQYLYPFDDPARFRRDNELGPVDWSDLKLSEMAMIGADRLLVLERGSATTKFYTVTVGEAFAVDARHLEVATRPTLEELSGDGRLGQVPVLDKRLVLSSDDFPEIGADLEGLVMPDRRTMIIVNDNDFGVDGVKTRFWRIEFGEDI